MVNEFERFGLERLRVLTGSLEILGGLGLLVGLKSQPILVSSAGGLALLMLIAFLVRLRMRDSLAASLPSLLLMLLNVLIMVRGSASSLRR